MCLMFIAALFTIARIRKQPKCPLTDAWIRIVVYDIYIYMKPVSPEGNQP